MQIKNFLVTKYEDLVKALETRQFYPWFETTGCCVHEVENAALATYDWQRLGIEDQAEDPTQANLLLVTGWINESKAEELRKAYELMRRPVSVIAIGACAISGSPFGFEGQKDKMHSTQDIIPVDVFVPGCPPKPEAILTALLELQRKLRPGPSAEEILYAALRN